jgi:hypothetical protein
VVLGFPFNCIPAFGSHTWPWLSHLSTLTLSSPLSYKTIEATEPSDSTVLKFYDTTDTELLDLQIPKQCSSNLLPILRFLTLVVTALNLLYLSSVLSNEIQKLLQTVASVI